MKNPKKTDQSLLDYLETFRSGNQSAISSVLKITKDRLFGFCVHLTGGDVHLAKDLCQEVHIKLFTDIGKTKPFRSEAGFYSWLFTVTKHSFLNLKRPFAARIEQHKTQNADDQQTGVMERLPQPASQDQETCLAIEETLAQLPEEDRMILLLVDYEGYPYAEAAEIMGMNEKTLCSRLLRCRKRFLEIFHHSS